MNRPSETELTRTLRSSYWRADEARVVLDAWERSGQSLAAFARTHGIHRARLQRWKQRFEDDERGISRPAAPTFYPVALAAGPARADDGGEGNSWRVELPGGVRVAVPCSGGADLLAETLTVVAEVWPC